MNMNTIEMAPDARVWVYQSNKELSEEDALQLKAKAIAFVKGWTAHDSQLKADAGVIYNRFLVLIVDEKQAMASGCSIDKSVKFVKDMEIAFNITLLDRMNLAYKKGDQVLSCDKAVFEELMQKGEITDDTIVFNNLVGTVGELASEWELPLTKSWHRNFVNKP
jgi:hypothetical protein